MRGVHKGGRSLFNMEKGGGSLHGCGDRAEVGLWCGRSSKAREDEPRCAADAAVAGVGGCLRRRVTDGGGAGRRGDGVAVFTRNGDTARAFAHDIEVGMVGINVPIPVPMAFHSFGGW